MAKFYGFDKPGMKRVVETVRWKERQDPPRKGPPGRTQGANVPGSVMTITAINNDTLTCTQVASGTTGVTVAKPYLLRRTPFESGERNGFSYVYSGSQARTSTKSSDGSEEEQEVVPIYFAGDQIVAIPIGGVTMSNSTELDDVRWIDINCDARSWAQAST